MSKKDDDPRPVVNPDPRSQAVTPEFLRGTALRSAEHPEGKPPDNAITQSARADKRLSDTTIEREKQEQQGADTIKNLTTRALVGSLMAQGLSREDAEERALQMCPEPETKPEG